MSYKSVEIRDHMYSKERDDVYSISQCMWILTVYYNRNNSFIINIFTSFNNTVNGTVSNLIVKTTWLSYYSIHFYHI